MKQSSAKHLAKGDAREGGFAKAVEGPGDNATKGKETDKETHASQRGTTDSESLNHVIDASNTAQTNPPTSSAAASSDVDDFLTRARALGLNLSRQDYERARAGVSAFLRAKRVSSAPTRKEDGPLDSHASSEAANGTEKGLPPHRSNSPHGSTSQQSTSRVGAMQKQTALSFFTAVETVQDPLSKPRPRLDDFGALEERRRRRERRRRLREKAEQREANDADCESGSHRCRKAASEPCEDSPFTGIGTDESPFVRSECSPAMDAATQTFKRSLRHKSISLSAEALARVGLGISDESLISPQSHSHAKNTAQHDVPQALMKAWREQHESLSQQSPGLSKLTRRAYIDSNGHLTLLQSPAKGCDRDMDDACAIEVQCSSSFRGDDDEEAIMANAGGETDDSGVCLTGEPVDAFIKKGIPSDDFNDFETSRAPSHRRRLSSQDSSTNDLHDGIDRLSFLERVMAQKKSPLRLRKEAKARDRQARLAAANNDLIVMTATTATVPQMGIPSAVESSQSAPSSSASSSTFISNNSTTMNAQDLNNKSVRWASDFGSPRKRTTTKEIYDYSLFGIAPSHVPHHGATFSAWESADTESVRRVSGGETGEEALQNHSRLRSSFSSTSFGSPVATRPSGLHTLIPDSPGILSLSINENLGAGSNAQFLAKRGLLFGGGSQATPPIASTTSSSLDGALGDLTNIFSQGPTLARSPARKGLIETETPPRLIRATTLAAPISLAQQAFGREVDGKARLIDGSPERSSLVRAHSFTTLERQNRSFIKHQSAPGSIDAIHNAHENKENSSSQPSSDSGLASSGRKIPRGWAHRSPASKTADTISPLAIFGQHQPQRVHQQYPPEASIQRNQQNSLRNRIPSSGSVSESEQKSGHFSASEAEGDDERDMSPIVLMQGKGSSLNASRRNKKVAPPSTHARSNSASSAFEESPLMLDTRSSKATVVARPTSSSSLAYALDMPNRQGSSIGRSVDQNAKRKKRDGDSVSEDTTMQKVQGSDANTSSASSQQVRQTVNEGNVICSQTMEWDHADGTRVVKLVSEELQAALESGALSAEPPARFYKLPSTWGRSKSKPQSVSYAGMIGLAILSSSDGRLSLNEIYNWISSVYPFYERGDRGWQNSIRHNLSLNKSFVKVERDASIPGKGGWWAIRSGHEERFRAGNYIIPGTAKAAKESSQQQSQSGKGARGALKDNAHHAERSQEAGSQSSAGARRKRLESNPSEVSDAATDSDSFASGDATGKNARKRLKKAKVAGKASGQVHSVDGTAKPVPVTLLRPEGTNASMLSHSPKHYGTITPSRPYQPSRLMGTSSSEMGSAYASSIMHGLPVLTDASSPPSSPHNVMPPPAGGIRGAASTQSAQKQMQSSMLNASSSLYGPGMNGTPLGFNGSFLHYALPASPLANMRSGAGANGLHGSTAMRSGVNLATAGMESPLRHSSDNSTTRMMVNSPVSNIRQSDENGGENKENVDQRKGEKRLGNLTNSSTKSPIRFLNHSPMRGSPLRPGGAISNQQHSSMMSPASTQLQMALGQSQQSSASSSFAAGASTPMTARWGYASPSPSRRMDKLFSPSAVAFSTPNIHGQVASSATGLDDPFDYSGNLQHEFDMTNELQFTQGEPSPMKGFEHHAFGHRNGIAHSMQFGHGGFSTLGDSQSHSVGLLGGAATATSLHQSNNGEGTQPSSSFPM